MSPLKIFVLTAALCMAGCGEKASRNNADKTATRDTAGQPDAHANAPASAPTSVLFRNVRVFNGIDPQLQDATDVLVRGNASRRSARSTRPPPSLE